MPAATSSTAAGDWPAQQTTPQCGFLSQPSLQPRPVVAHASRERVILQQEKVLGGSAASGDKGKGPIANLQEYVQGSKEFSLPSNCQILQWCCEERMIGANLEFRFTVRFLLDGIPHHTMGTWQSSKADAKRDTAQRSLGLFVTRWGQLAVSASDDSFAIPSFADGKTENVEAARSNNEADDAAATLQEAQVLARYCHPLCWSFRRDGQDYIALVEVHLLGVSHTFNGCSSHSLVEACRDTARRVLWYLQCPGFEDTFEPECSIEKAKDIPLAPLDWRKQDSSENEEETARQKTVLMRLQNRLQQAYSKRIDTGTSAIEWNFEQNKWPSHVRATAWIPAVGRSFSSAWQRTQREAQIDACNKVFKFLDEIDPEDEAHGRRSRRGSGS